MTSLQLSPLIIHSGSQMLRTTLASKAVRLVMCNLGKPGIGHLPTLPPEDKCKTCGVERMEFDLHWAIENPDNRSPQVQGRMWTRHRDLCAKEWKDEAKEEKKQEVMNEVQIAGSKRSRSQSRSRSPSPKRAALASIRKEKEIIAKDLTNLGDMLKTLQGRIEKLNSAEDAMAALYEKKVN